MQRRETYQQRYSHAQWKLKYEAAQKALQETTEQCKIAEQLAAITALENSEKHYEYYYEPRQLLESLLDDIEKIFTNYNKTFLINQSNEVRFCMLEISTLMHKIRRANDRLHDKQLLETKCRDHYEILCDMLERHSVELKFHDTELHKQLLIVLKKHYITPPVIIPISDFSLDKKDLDILRHAEKAAYQEALKELRTTLAHLPETAVEIKKSGEDLIKHIEAKQETRKESSCFFRKTPFDYKRHTINLKSTTELLKSPFDYKKQNDYQDLINSNIGENQTNSIAKQMALFFLGVLAVAIGLVAVVLSQGALVPVIAGSICMTGGTGMATFSAFKHKFMPTTATHIANIADKTKEYTEGTNHNQCCL